MRGNSPGAYDEGMTSTETAAPEAAEDAPRGWDWLDTCGVAAAVIVILIAADIFTDGRLISRRLRKPPAAPEPAEVPGE